MTVYHIRCFFLCLTISILPMAAEAQSALQLNSRFLRMRELSYRGENGAALLEAQKFEAGVRKLFGISHPNYAHALTALGNCLVYVGRYEEAETLFKNTVPIREKQRDKADLGSSFNSLAVVYEKQGKYAKAEEFYKRALEIEERFPSKDVRGISGIGSTLENLGNLYREEGRYS